MILTPSKLRKANRLLPAISALSAALLLTGEWFSCCRINQAFSHEVRVIAQSIGLLAHDHSVAMPDGDQDEADADHHAHCHGHAAVQPATADFSPGSAAAAFYTQDGSCLSESSLAKKAMVENISFTLGISPALAGRMEVPELALCLSASRPRPQNRSSVCPT